MNTAARAVGTYFSQLADRHLRTYHESEHYLRSCWQEQVASSREDLRVIWLLPRSLEDNLQQALDKEIERYISSQIKSDMRSFWVYSEQRYQQAFQHSVQNYHGRGALCLQRDFQQLLFAVQRKDQAAADLKAALGDDFCQIKAFHVIRSHFPSATEYAEIWATTIAKKRQLVSLIQGSCHSDPLYQAVAGIVAKVIPSLVEATVDTLVVPQMELIYGLH